MSDDANLPISERIVRAIEERAERYRADLVEPIPDPDDPFEPASFVPILRPIMEPKIAGLEEAARIVRMTSPWVAVEDGLPEYGRDVLVAAGRERIVAHYDEESVGWFVEITGYNIEDGYVTHWAPLPELPVDAGNHRKSSDDEIGPLAREMIAGLEDFLGHLKAGGRPEDYRAGGEADQSA